MRVYSPAEARGILAATETLYASMFARQAYGDHICLAAFPVTEHGSPDQIVEGATAKAAQITGGWAGEIGGALEGAHTEAAIREVLAKQADAIDVAAFAELLFEKMLTALMLGGLDSQAEHENLVRTTAFRLKAEDKAFVYQPRAAAQELWEKRQVLDPETFAALSDKLRQRAFSFAGAAKDELLNVVHAELARQIKTGTVDLRQFRRFAKERMEKAGWTPVSPTHVETIFRTNTASAMAAGRHAEMTQPDVIAALPYWQSKAIMDARARDTHKAANGIILPANHQFWRHAYPPYGFNCFLPGTEIRGLVVGASRAFYSGKAVELTTAKGRRLTVTANHPILTTEGFVAASSLRQGDKLVSYCGESGVALLGPGTQGHEDHGPALAEDVFRALAEAGDRDLADHAPEDFHGEARSFVGQVEVVGSYRRLVGELPAARGQEHAKLGLESTAAPALSAGASFAAFGRIDVASPAGPGAPALPLDGSGVEPQGAPLREFRFGAPSELDALLTEGASEGRTADSGLVGELLQRGAGVVELDEVLWVREFDFAGHVYDFQTANGWLFGSGVVSSNCRCQVIARTAAWVKRTGATIGPVPRDLPDPGFTSGTRNMVVVPVAIKPKAQPVQPQPVAAPQSPERDARRQGQVSPSVPVLEQEHGLPKLPVAPPAAPAPIELPKPAKPRKPKAQPVENLPQTPPPLPDEERRRQRVAPAAPPPQPAEPPPPAGPPEVPKLDGAPVAPDGWTWVSRPQGGHALVPRGNPNAKPRAHTEHRPGPRGGKGDWVLVTDDGQEVSLGKRATFDTAENALAKIDAKRAAQAKKAAKPVAQAPVAAPLPAGPPVGAPVALPPPSGVAAPLPPPPETTFAEMAAAVDKPMVTEKSVRQVFGSVPSAADIRAVSGRSVIPNGEFSVVEFSYTGHPQIQTSLRTGTVDIQRTFMRDGQGRLVVYHDYFSLPENMQAHGIGRSILRQQLQAYQRMGVTRIELDAAAVGRYAWPRMGFRLKKASDMVAARKAFKAWLKKRGIRGATRIADSIESVHQIAIARLGERQIGKEFLLNDKSFGLSLEVELDPSDPAYADLLKYLGLPMP